MITTEIKEIKKIDGRAYITVLFIKDGAPYFTEQFIIRDTTDTLALKRMVSSRIAQVSTADTISASLTLGAFDPTINETPTLTQAQIDRNTWNEHYQKLRQCNEAVSQGVFPSNNTKYVALKNLVSSTFKAEYLNLV